MDSNHCMLESKSSALPLGDSPTSHNFYDYVSISKKNNFVNTFFILIEKNFFII